MLFDLSDEKLFWKTLKNELITYKLGKKRRGPLSPSENLSEVFYGDFIDVSEVQSMYTISLFPEHEQKLNEFLFQMNVAEQKSEKNKVMSKTLPGVLSEEKTEEVEILDFI